SVSNVPIRFTSKFVGTKTVAPKPILTKQRPSIVIKIQISRTFCDRRHSGWRERRVSVTCHDRGITHPKNPIGLFKGLLSPAARGGAVFTLRGVLRRPRAAVKVSC